MVWVCVESSDWLLFEYCYSQWCKIRLLWLRWVFSGVIHGQVMSAKGLVRLFDVRIDGAVSGQNLVRVGVVSTAAPVDYWKVQVGLVVSAFAQPQPLSTASNR